MVTQSRKKPPPIKGREQTEGLDGKETKEMPIHAQKSTKAYSNLGTSIRKKTQHRG